MKTKSFRCAFTFVAVMLVVLAVFPCVKEAQATAPQSVDLSYDSASQTLTVTITHSTLAKSFHYIKYVNIKQNGKDVSSNTYENQPDSKTFTYTYKLPPAEGDTLEVTAICSMWGQKTATLTVAKR